MNFRNRISISSKNKSKIILANDLENIPLGKLENKTISNIKSLNKFLCAIKFNFHVILPLGIRNFVKINRLAHDFGLQTIADIKLNDIGNTNKVTEELFWLAGFDAIIVNPIMGPENLKNLISSAHAHKNGIISLVHMSHPGAKLGYGLSVKPTSISKPLKLDELFLNWSYSLGTDGIIVGATVPKIIEKCYKKIKNRSDIYSPGIGIQGGDPKKAIKAGATYLIVGRTILNSKNPVDEAKKLCNLVI